MDEMEYQIAELRWRIEKLRNELGYHPKPSHPQKSVESTENLPQKSVSKNDEMDAIKAKLLGKKT